MNSGTKKQQVSCYRCSTDAIYINFTLPKLVKNIKISLEYLVMNVCTLKRDNKYSIKPPGGLFISNTFEGGP